jgi:mRNA-degrading endonuclease RelE of RelBE toxin-antitoxin system
MRVSLSSHARKSYERLARSDRRLFTRVDRALDRLARDPEAGKPLQGPLRGRRSLRVGSMRIIYRHEHERLLILVLEITHRQGAYR